MKVRTTDEPHDRLTKLGDVMLQALALQDGADDVQAIVMLSDGKSRATCLAGFEEGTNEPLIEMFVHLSAIFSSAGKTLTLIPVSDPRQN